METISKIRPIWLVQRAGIPTPLAPTDSTLTNSLHLEYMGSAEFEFGALPKSLRHLRSAHEQGDMVIRLVPEITQGESPLRVLSTFDDTAFADYTKELHRLRYHNPPPPRKIPTFNLTYRKGIRASPLAQSSGGTSAMTQCGPLTSAT